VDLAGSSTQVVNLNDLAANPGGISTGSVQVYSAESSETHRVLLGVMDIQNAVNQFSLGSRVGKDWTFPHVAHGVGLFIRLCLVTQLSSQHFLRSSPVRPGFFSFSGHRRGRLAAVGS
jgi:hypothetical protein